jgi:hypothetical protein
MSTNFFSNCEEGSNQFTRVFIKGYSLNVFNSTIRMSRNKTVFYPLYIILFIIIILLLHIKNIHTLLDKNIYDRTVINVVYVFLANVLHSVTLQNYVKFIKNLQKRGVLNVNIRNHSRHRYSRDR